MSKSHTVARRVEFRDTDAAGIMHFSAFFTYMEESEHDFWRALGLSVMMPYEGETLSWPRVNATCDFSGALRFEDEFEVSVSVERLGTKSLTYGFEFTRESRSLARGRMTVVCCRISAGGPPVSVEIPGPIRESLLPFVSAAGS